MSDRVRASVGTELSAQLNSRIGLAADPISKWIMDLCFASLGLLLTAPLWALIGFLIWLEDGRPVLLLQERVGREGKLFQLLKFRTMRRNAEAAGVIEDREHDPRVTKMGRILRATALDELPQLLNILKGNMSFVGPRALPLRIEDLERTRYRTVQDIEGYALRSMVRPGLTGIPQIFGPKDMPRRNKFRYDLLYIKRWNFWVDLKLIILSVWITLRGRWETRGPKV